MAVVTHAETWPMPVAQFLAGNYLQRSDIVLCRGKRSLFSWLIRMATRSYFSHAGLIFLVPNPHEGSIITSSWKRSPAA